MEKSEMMPFAATWMDLNIIILGEVGQTDRDRYHVMSLICGLKKKKKGTNELAFKTETDSQLLKSSFWLPEGKRGDMVDWEMGIGLACAHYRVESGELIRTYCITQGALLSILRWPIREKNLRKNAWICIHLWWRGAGSLCCIPEANTVL